MILYHNGNNHILYTIYHIYVIHDIWYRLYTVSHCLPLMGPLVHAEFLETKLRTWPTYWYFAENFHKYIFCQNYQHSAINRTCSGFRV